MSKNSIKTSDVVGNIIKKARAKRQEGDVNPKNPNLVWTKTPSGFDWRKKKGSGGTKKTAMQKMQKLKETLGKTDSDKLKTYANKPQNSPDLRQMAYDELVERGEDVSDIDLSTGRLGKMKNALTTSEDDADDMAELVQVDVEEDVVDDDDTEWTNPDYIKKKFGGLKTKSQRIKADAFIHNKKINQENYVPPQVEINDLNRTYAQFLRTDSPLLMASGGAGVGKSYNFHLLADFLGKKPFDPDTDTPGDGDYDYVEAPEIKSDVQLAQLLKEHNGKIILFDDSDNVLRNADTLGIMKKATASSGKRILGKKSSNKNTNVDPFEYTGKIAFLTNMSQDEMTKNENYSAIYSRALKKDIQFTKREQLGFISMLKDKFNFTGVKRLEDETLDQKERQEVFDLIKNNIDNIDPQKFNSRTMKEALEIKRSIDGANADFDINPTMAAMLFGQKEDWKQKVESFLTKGQLVRKNDSSAIMKAKKTLGLDD